MMMSMRTREGESVEGRSYSLMVMHITYRL